MINKEMNDKSEEVETQKPAHEAGGFCFSSIVKIFDPETQEILVQQRGDN